MPTPSIDSAIFAQLQATAGTEFVSDLVDAFREEAPQLLAQLRSALAAQSGDGFRRAAHSLKSNATTFGALPLAELARALEHADLAAVQPVTLVALDDACRQAIATLEELCRD
jgi:histidine phosphotransfer protein HptB